MHCVHGVAESESSSVQPASQAMHAPGPKVPVLAYVPVAQAAHGVAGSASISAEPAGHGVHPSTKSIAATNRQLLCDKFEQVSDPGLRSHTMAPSHRAATSALPLTAGTRGT